jgi:alpha-tubulin suppressor-like RCC1 family protein
LVPADAYDVVQLTAGMQHSVALRADGVVVAWPPPPVPFAATSLPQDLGPASVIGAGEQFSIAVTVEVESCDVGKGDVDCDANGLKDSCDIESGAADADSDGRLDSCEIAAADIDLDGEVGSSDLGVLLSGWGVNAKSLADFDRDGMVDSADLGYLLSRWGPVQ